MIKSLKFIFINALPVKKKSGKKSGTRTKDCFLIPMTCDSPEPGNKKLHFFLFFYFKYRNPKFLECVFNLNLKVFLWIQMIQNARCWTCSTIDYNKSRLEQSTAAIVWSLMQRFIDASRWIWKSLKNLIIKCNKTQKTFPLDFLTTPSSPLKKICPKPQGPPPPPLEFQRMYLYVPIFLFVESGQ